MAPAVATAPSEQLLAKARLVELSARSVAHGEGDVGRDQAPEGGFGLPRERLARPLPNLPEPGAMTRHQLFVGVQLGGALAADFQDFLPLPHGEAVARTVIRSGWVAEQAHAVEQITSSRRPAHGQLQIAR